jgi:ArsR family transcriptional regulator, arsenate/arsenite/antimonite-responsive transcriptional repressor
MLPRYSEVLPRRWQGIAEVFTALGDEHRQRILLLFQHGGELTIKEVLARVLEARQVSRTALAHHLRVLRESGVLLAERRGKEVYLRLDPKRVLEAIEGLRSYIKDEFKL